VTRLAAICHKAGPIRYESRRRNWLRFAIAFHGYDRFAANWHLPCSMIRHEPPKCLLLMDFAGKGVPNAHTRVTPWHHTAATESLAIIEDSRSKSLGRTTLRMKCITIFLFSAGVLCAADFTTGQAARLVIGQPTFTSQDSNSSDTILGAASGLAFAADTLFVADSNRVGASPSNHRVLLFQNVSGMLPRPTDQLTYNSKCPVCVGHATVVLGQPDFTTATENLQATPTTLRLPTAVASDGVHVVVADTNHNRVLIWNRIPTSNNTPAASESARSDHKLKPKRRYQTL